MKNTRTAVILRNIIAI